MYSHWQLAAKYVRFFLSSRGSRGHGIHSPFIFHFITNVLNDRQHYPEYDRVEGLRDQLLKNNTVLTVEDLGAGSSGLNTKRRTVSAIARHAVKQKKIGQLLFRLVKEYQPESILELGTSLGVTTSYLSLARPGSRLFTLEGAKEVAGIAAANFKSLGLKNILITEGNFDQTLPIIISPLQSVDFAFIDGNHRREPTERYFLQLLSKINNDSILVFDDIHWSREMEETWEAIKSHPAVRSSIDLFFTGIVFFRQEFREKQHFSIRF